MLWAHVRSGVLLLTICGLTPASVMIASAQDSDTSTTAAADRATAADRDDVGFDAGWLGLLGLAGLAGLAGRNRNHTRDTTSREAVGSHR